MQIDIRTIAIFFLLILISTIIGLQVSVISPLKSFGLILGIIIIIVSFLNTECSLYILIFSMLLSPEFGATRGGIAEGRSVVIRIDDILLVIIGFSWFARTAVDKRLGLFLRTPINKFIFSYALVLLFSTVFGMFIGRVQPLSGFFYLLKYIEYYIVYFMVANHIQNTTQAKRFLGAALLTLIIVSIYAILQIPKGIRVTAPFEGEHGEANTLGGYLVFMLSILLGLLLNIKDRRVIFFLLGVMVLIFVPLMATLSRSSWLAMIPMYLTLLYFSDKKLILIVGLIFLLALSPLILTKSVKERAIKTIKENEQIPGTIKVFGFVLDQSASDRIMHYKTAIKMWLKKPILGYGVTGGFLVDAQFFRVLVEGGLAGLIAFCLLLRAIYINLKENYRKTRTPFGKGLTLGVLAGLFAIIGHCFGASSFIIVRIMEPFWFFVAIAIMMPELEKRDEEQMEEVV